MPAPILFILVPFLAAPLVYLAQAARGHFQLSLRIEPTNVATLRLLEQSQEELGDSAGVTDTRSRLITLSGTTP